MDLEDIKSVIELMTDNGLSEFELEKDDFKIRIKRGPDGTIATSAIPVAAAPVAPVQAAAPAAAAPSGDDGFEIIEAPMVGTFYRAPSPESKAYVEVGAEVNDESVVCIIEAMKVMNEIKAEMRGQIVDILVENGSSVEFGKPLFKVRPA